MNKAVQDLAVAAGGEAAWTAVRTRAGVGVPAFVAMEPYDDDVTSRLVAAAAEHFGWPADTVLEAFGEHWITFTAQEGYGPLLGAMGSSLPEFLGALDGMHTRVRLTLPALRPPSFLCEEVGDGHLRLHYSSERDGLAPMVVGLLRGLGTRFGLAVDVVQTARRADGHDVDVFDVRYVPVAARAGTAVP